MDAGHFIFPLFILGASTKEPSIIDFVMKGFDELEKRGMLQVSRMLETSSQ